MIKTNAIKTDINRRWMNTELTKADAMLFTACLIIEGIKYEKSAAGDLIHFEVYVNDKEFEACEKCLAAM